MAKLKAELEVCPFGVGSKVFAGEVDDATARFLLESGRCTEEDFEELPVKATKAKPSTEVKK